MKKRFFCLLVVIGFFHNNLKADSLDIKIGQMLIVGLSGTSVNDSSPIVNDIKKGLVGGVLYFEANLNPINTEKNLAVLSQKLKSSATIPLFISIDQEGGKVNRLKTKYGFPAMPSAQEVGEKNDDTFTKEVGNTIAKSCAKVGVNLNFAPVLDVYNPNCPVLGKVQRCYSNNVEEIAHDAAITIKSHRLQNVKTVLKHFPGHGNSLADTHLGLADVTKVWQQNELIPYKMLIDLDLVDCIMTSHIVNRKLEPSGLPATLSKKIITGILRKQLNYNGVVVSDDMQMHAITKYYNLEESLKKAINAGVDMMIFSNNIKGSSNYNPKNIHATIKNLVSSGQISEDRINESFVRIMKMKEGLK